MRVLAHIHTFNDADIIDRTIAAVRAQTRPVDGILVVDNASTDGTLERPSVKSCAVLRHRENLGTSGAVESGFRYAEEQGYDWIWVFDADSTPDPDALEKLLALYDELPAETREETAFVASLPRNSMDGQPVHGQRFDDRRGVRVIHPAPDERYYPCHVTIWSGCLYRMAAVRRIGPPNASYVLDAGDCEYGYRVMKAGFKGFIHQGSVVRHNIRGSTSFRPVQLKLGPLTLHFFELPPIRCYYGCRNTLYFALYDRTEAKTRLVILTVIGVVRITANFLLRPATHLAQILACTRGVWHGVTGNIAARY